MRNKKVARLTFMSMLFALAIVLSIMESMIPALPMLPPGIKIGLSNIITMYTLFFMGPASALVIVVLKALFAFIIRGFTASVLSFCGGLISVAVMYLLIAATKKKISYTLASVVGAIAHNIGQISAASVILESNLVFYYLPVLMFSGAIMGLLTGVLLNVVMPIFSRIRKE